MVDSHIKDRITEAFSTVPPGTVLRLAEIADLIEQKGYPWPGRGAIAHRLLAVLKGQVIWPELEVFYDDGEPLRARLNLK